MGAIWEEGAHDGVKKKSKKRKNEESISHEEVRNVQLGGKDSRKMKHELLCNANASEVVGDPTSDSGAGKTHKKEKIMQNDSKIDGKGQEKNVKRKKNKEKNKVRDEGGSSSVLEAPEENPVLKSDGGVACHFEKEKKKKKSKNDKHQRIDVDCNIAIDGAGLLEIQADSEVMAKIEAAEDKKKKRKEEKKKKRKNDKAERVDADSSGEIDGADLFEFQDSEVIEKGEAAEDKKKKKKKRKESDGSGSSVISEKNKSVGVDFNGEDQKRKEKKVKEIVKNGETNKTNEVVESCDRSTSHKKMKKVTFSDQNEYFSMPESSSKRKQKTKLDDDDDDDDEDDKGNTNQDDGLIRGKRFSKEEDKIVEKAVLDYIEEHQLGENGIEMVMKCKSYPEVKDCWKEIGKALPHRPYVSVYYRAHILFERSESRKWSQEELDLVKSFYEKHGSNWKTLAEELGKHRFHVKDAWRRIRYPNRKKGGWSQDEYQTLFDLVNLDLSMKVFQEKKSKHGMLRDNISWEVISTKLATRSNSMCCLKWYDQLTSPMVAQGKWADSDDYRLLIALTELDAACEEDVDWDNLLEHRSGDVCQERWNQMVRHIGHHGVKPFVEQVDILSQRYCPELLEAREEYEKKPVVD